MRSKKVAPPSANFCRTRHPRAHGRPPGVSTYLSARGRRVYPLRQRWIEDFALCCRLVPTTASLTRFPFVIPCICGILPQQDDLLQKHRHRHLLVLPLHPSPPSGWIRDLPGSVTHGARLTLKNTCRARHTTKACTWMPRGSVLFGMNCLR